MRGARVPAGGGGERRQFERKSGTLPDSQKKMDQGWGSNNGPAELDGGFGHGFEWYPADSGMISRRAWRR